MCVHLFDFREIGKNRLLNPIFTMATGFMMSIGTER